MYFVGWRFRSVAVCLPNMHKALDLIYSTTENQTKTKPQNSILLNCPLKGIWVIL